MANNDFQIRVNDNNAEIAAMLRKLADADRRNLGDETAWLIEQEYARRFSKPNPGVLVSDAVSTEIA